MKIAIIGPGFSPIPPVGWGAVEIIVWNYKQYLEKLGHSVTIFNTTDLLSITDTINNSDFDFVHLHYDEHAPFFNDHLKKTYFITGHYGWILQPDKWEHHYYDRIFSAMMNAPGLIALSPTIAEFYKANGAKGVVTFLRNGVECDNFRVVASPTKQAVCVGKVEPRKRQFELSQALEGGTHVDYVGGMHDERFKSSETNHYLGHWDKQSLYQNLTDYAALILMSDGEAAPLVVIEALSAGVSVIVSEKAKENLTPSPFVKIVSEATFSNWPEFKQIVQLVVEENVHQRFQIREYARHFDYGTVVQEYIELISRIIA